MKKLNDLPKESQEALINGASMFIVPLSGGQQNFEEYMIDPIDIISVYQICDEVYIAEDGILLMSNPTQPKIIYKATIKNVKVVRLHDLNTQDVVSIMSSPNMFFEDWYSKQYENYKDNPYVFLYEVEELLND